MTERVSAKARVFYHATVADFTPDLVQRSVRALTECAADEGYDVTAEPLQFWSKSDGWFMFCVVVNHTLEERAQFHAQQINNGWWRQA